MIMTTTKKNEATVITHGGIFHADEVLSTVILSKVLGSDIKVLRTFKVPEELDEKVVVYDIGFGEFDHHQKGGNGARENGVPYSSVGLIWKKFGRTIVANCDNPELVWNIIDRDLIQGIDAADNGALPVADYPAQVMQFYQMISGFNPNWNNPENSDDAFLKAVSFAEIVFDNTFSNAVAKAKAQQIVDEAIEKSKGRIMVLDHFVPWQEFIFASKNEKAEDIEFIIYPSNRGGYNWQCVPDTLGGYGQRKPVPAEWYGLHGEALQETTGVKTATFCHPNGFMGSASTLEDAIKLAKIAVEA